jgi:hypothetical protein
MKAKTRLRSSDREPAREITGLQVQTPVSQKSTKQKLGPWVQFPAPQNQIKPLE